MKLTNTWKHILIGLGCGLLVSVLRMLILLIPNTSFEIGWLAVFAFALGCFFWEYWQYVAYGSKRYYWQMRGLDTIADFCSGVGSFILTLWAFGAL